MYNYRDNSHSYGYRVRPGFDKESAVTQLIIANAIAFLVFLLAPRFITNFLGLKPVWTWGRFFIWQPATYMFIHGGFWHIFINMFILWMFGKEIETIWGKKEFLKYYFITGIGSGLITLIFSWNSPIPVVGASGAIYGLLVAFGMMFPSRRIYLWFLFPIQAKYLVIIMGVVTFFSTFSGQQSNVSHLTHLGGLLIGFLYMYFKGVDINIPTLNIPKINIKFKNPFRKIIRKVDKEESRSETTTEEFDTDLTLKEQMDEILDKINREGYENLTKQEKQTLYLASQYFAKKNKEN
ncbi:MAG: rhomboid family intramembrane serine protease [Candidatus Marinimicrobia bacterium]|nr:rhomboid family intramembrane serine protease [Candidatus Neomarinimicrobiota bacterium]